MFWRARAWSSCWHCLLDGGLLGKWSFGFDLLDEKLSVILSSRTWSSLAFLLEGTTLGPHALSREVWLHSRLPWLGSLGAFSVQLLSSAILFVRSTSDSNCLNIGSLPPVDRFWLWSVSFSRVWLWRTGLPRQWLSSMTYRNDSPLVTRFLTSWFSVALLITSSLWSIGPLE